MEKIIMMKNGDCGSKEISNIEFKDSEMKSVNTKVKGECGGASDIVGILELTAEQAQGLINDTITFTEDQANIIKTHQLLNIRYADMVDFKGMVSKVQGVMFDEPIYTLMVFLGNYMLYCSIRDSNMTTKLNPVVLPTNYTFEAVDNTITWSDGDYDRNISVDTINGKAIIHNDDSDVIDHIAPPVLPSDASTNTYVLKAINGTLTWVKE